MRTKVVHYDTDYSRLSTVRSVCRGISEPHGAGDSRFVKQT